jgi:hypothetical protein
LVHLTALYLMLVHITALYLNLVHLTALYLMLVHITALYLNLVHLTALYLMLVHLTALYSSPYHSSYHTTVSDLGEACVTRDGWEERIQYFVQETCKNCLEDLGIDGRVILKLMLNKMGKSGQP